MSEAILAHIHVPKCGGTSVRFMLNEIWADKHLQLYVEGPTTFVYNSSELIDRLSPPNVKAFSSHYVRTFPPTIANRPLRYVTFLRDPLQQWISYLTYTRKVYGQIADPVLLAHLPPNMPTLSLRDCASWLMARDPRSFVNFRENYLTTFFARYELENSDGISYGDQRYLRLRQGTAREVLQRFFFVGITERMDESLRLLRGKLAGTELELPSMKVRVENVSHEQRDDLSWLAVHDPLGREVLQSLSEDISLYQWARSHFETELTCELEGKPSGKWTHSLFHLSSTVGASTGVLPEYAKDLHQTHK